MSQICPKCGFEQDSGEECRRCGILFARYSSDPDRQPPEEAFEPGPPARSTLRRFYRVFRWVALAVSVIVVILILRQAPPPQVEVDPDAGLRLQSKLRGTKFSSFYPLCLQHRWALNLQGNIRVPDRTPGLKKAEG